jgi:pentose-5-phosphate-3-epimerase
LAVDAPDRVIRRGADRRSDTILIHQEAVANQHLFLEITKGVAHSRLNGLKFREHGNR